MLQTQQSNKCQGLHCPLAITASHASSTGSFLGKRFMDISLALTMLLVLLPFLLVIALLIKLTSRGPVLFRQRRVGARRQAGREKKWVIRVFRMYKFRSMVNDADQALHQDHIREYVNGCLSNGSSAGFKIDGDPRITRLGRILRRTSLDELPQLFNVLRGDMSLVGPRPVPDYEVAEYREWHYERLGALPGITGLWQLSGRGDLSFEKMVRLDIRYVRTRSMWLDLTYLVRTIPAVLWGRGAT